MENAVTTDKIKEIEAKIADLKGRWPKHSVKPIFWQQLEDLEAQLEAAQKEAQDQATAQEQDTLEHGAGTQKQQAEKKAARERRILALAERAKQTNDFIKFDRYLKQLHKLRTE